MDGNLAALALYEARQQSGIEQFEKMMEELIEKILDDSEESESIFNSIVSDYGFEYNFRDFAGDEL